MEFTKKDLVYLLGFCIMFYYLKSKTEKLANTDIDVEAIRNLSNYANQLTKDGKLVVPGGLEIEGTLKMKGLELYPDGDNRLVIKNSNGQAAIGSRNKYYFHIESDKDFYLNNNLTAAGNITGKKDIKAEGNGYFGPAYIGKYGKTRDDYAQFSHVKQTGTSNYAITQHHNGSSMFNAPSGKSASIRVDDSVKLNVTGNVDIKKNLNVNDNITSKTLNVSSTLKAANNKFKVYTNSRGSGELSLYRKNGKEGVFLSSNYTYKGNHPAGLWLYDENGSWYKNLS